MPGTNIDHAEENAEVEVLLSQATKQAEIGKKISAAVNKIQDSTNRLQDLVGPAYNDTQVLQVMNKNIDDILSGIERRRAPFDGKANEERIIHAGMVEVGLKIYLESLTRVQRGFEQMAKVKMRTSQESAQELRRLLDFGADQLKATFEQLIQQTSNRIEPQGFMLKGKPFPQIPAENAADLHDINSFGARSGTRWSPIKIYVVHRSKYLTSSLENMALASTASAEKKRGEDTYRVGTCLIGNYTQAIEGFFHAEWDNITAIFSANESSTVFKETTRPAISMFARCLQDLNGKILNSMPDQCFLAFEILDAKHKLSNQVGEFAGGFLKTEFTDAARPVRETAKQSLHEMLEDIRRRIGSLITLPQDSAAIKYTTEVMERLQSMTRLRDPVTSVMADVGDGGWSTSLQTSSSRPLDVGPNSDELLAHYIRDAIEVLFSSLEGKARSLYKEKPRLGIFIANNVAVAERMTRTSDLQDFIPDPLPTSSSPTPTKFEPWRKKSMAAYLDGWRDPCGTLMETQYTNRGPRPQSGGVLDSAAVIKAMSSKERDSIKEKFKQFNFKFEELIKAHREMQASMEREVKSHATREVTAMVEPLYSRFWDRYHELDKGRGKYVKWDKGGMSAQLASLE